MKAQATQLESVLQGALPSLICIRGNDDFLKRDALERVLRTLHGETPASEDLDRRAALRSVSEEQVVELFDDLRTPSLFGGGKTIIIDRAEAYLAYRDLWLAAIQQPWQGARLILSVADLDGRTKLAKEIEKRGLVISADTPFHRPPPWMPRAKPWENPLNEWVVARARSEGHSIDPPTAHLLASRFGPHLAEIAAFLDRMSTLLPEGVPLDRATVEAHAPHEEASNLFELVDASFTEPRAALLTQLRELLHRGHVDGKGNVTTDPSALLLQFSASLTGRVRQLRDIRYGLGRNDSNEELMKYAGVPKFLVPKLKEQARQFRLEDETRILRALVEADRSLKTGLARPEEAFFTLLARIRHEPRSEKS